MNHKEFHILVEEEGGNGCESKLKPDEPSPVPHDSKSKVKPHTHKTPDTGKIKKKPSNESAKGGKANKDKKPDDMTNCEIVNVFISEYAFLTLFLPCFRILSGWRHTALSQSNLRTLRSIETTRAMDIRKN